MALTEAEELELLELEEAEASASLKEQTPTPSIAESALGGLQKGASLGTLPYIVGVAAGLGSLSEGGDFSSAYEQGKAEELARAKELEAANPKAYMAGNIAGGVVIPGAGIGSLAAQGAVAGAATEEGGLWEKAKSAALGATIGAGAKLGGEAAAKSAGKAIDALQPLYNTIKTKVGAEAAQKWLETQAGVLAEKSAGIGRTLGQRAKLVKEYALGKTEAGDVGKELLKQGIVTKGASSKDIAERVYSAQQKAGEDIGKVTNEMLDVGPEVVQSKLLNKAQDLKDYGPNVSLKRNLETAAETYAPKSEDEIAMLSGADLQSFKSQLGKQADWSQPQTDPKALENIAVREALTESMTPAQREAYEAANRQYALLSPVASASSSKAAADEGKNLISVGAAPAMILAGGGGLPSLAGAAAYRTAQKRGAQFAAGTMWDAAKLIERAPERLKGVLQSSLKRGGNSFASTHYLLQQSDPEYQKATLEDGEGTE
jgi:hypothetical protein